MYVPFIYDHIFIFMDFSQECPQAQVAVAHDDDLKLLKVAVSINTLNHCYYTLISRIRGHSIWMMYEASSSEIIYRQIVQVNLLLGFLT